MDHRVKKTFPGLLAIMATCTMLALLQTAAKAQIITSSISGTVVDPSKAAIKGATVTLGTAGNPKVRQIKTNDEGFFNLADVQPDTYTITIEAKGFGKLSDQEIVVTAAQNVSLGQMQLAVGAFSEEVTVTSDITGIDRETPNSESQLSTKELTEISVRSYDPMEALTLLPGTVDTASGQHDSPSTTSGTTTNINGFRTESNNVMIDGVASTDPADNATINTLPSIGMIQELKLTASNYRADSGRNAGPSVIIVTKGGGDQVHGSFDLPVRNEFFDANDPDQKRQGLPKPQYRLVLPDITVTGPILIPHVISRQQHLFFAVSFQYQSQSQNPLPNVKLATVPTLLERQGNFQGDVTYPSNAALFNNLCLNQSAPSVVAVPGGCATQIASTSITPLGQQILNLYPLPNHAPAVSGGIGGTFYNYQSTTVSTLHRQSELYRVDWQPTSRLSMYFRVLYSPQTAQAAWNPSNAAGTGGFSAIGWNDGYFQEQTLGTGFLYNLTNILSSSLVNTLGLSTSTTRTLGSALNPSGITAAGTGISLPQIFPGSNSGGYLPNIEFGCQGLPNNSECPSTLFQDQALAGFGLDQSFPNHQHLHSFQLTDNITKTWRTHSFVAGIFFEFVHRNFVPNFVNDRGSYSFQTDGTNPCNTGDPWANILVGCIDSYYANSARPTAYIRFKNNEAYIQDEWRANSRLTLTYGIRFYHDPPAHDALNQYQVFVPSLYSRTLAPRLYVPCNYGTSCSYDPGTGTIVGPNLRDQLVPNSSSLANQETDGIVQAGTHGIPRTIFTNPTVSTAPRFGFNYAVTADGKTILKGGGGIYYDRYPLNNQLQMLSNPPANQQFLVQYIESYAALQSLQGSASPPALTTLPLGRFIPPTTKSYSLELQRQIGSDGLLGVAYIGNNSQHQVARQQINAPPIYAQLTLLNPQNSDLSYAPGACAGANCAEAGSYLNPYYGFGTILSETMSSSSNYNGLQVSMAKRYLHRHLQLRGNWTYSKALGNAPSDTATLLTYPGQEPISTYAPMPFDRRHLINFFPIIDIPDPGRLVDSRFISGVGRNWSISGIWRFSTGAPFTPNVLCYGVPGAGGNGLINTSTQQITGSPDLARVVTVNRQAKLVAGDANGVFDGPEVGTWGNTGLNAFHLPYWQQFDATLYRTFHPSEHFSMIFRAEVYNIPNSAIVSNLNTNLNYNYTECASATSSVCNIHSLVPVPAYPGAPLQGNTSFYTPAGGGQINGNLSTFYRHGRIIQFDISGRW